MTSECMYSVTKKIEFCYGHRLLDYDGICKHPHGHNAVAEIEVRSGSLDNRNMVCDFSDIKRIVKGWVDRELDHKMILREDDPLVGPLKQLGEPVFVVQSNPTVEHIAKLLYDYTHSQGFPVVRVTVWETPTSFATFGGEELDDRSPISAMPRTRLAVFDLDGTLIDSRRDLADSANEMLAGYGGPAPGRRSHRQHGRMRGPTLVKRVMTAAGVDAPLEDALARFLSAYDARLTHHTRPYDGIPGLLDELQSRCSCDGAAHQQAAGAIRQDSRCVRAVEIFSVGGWRRRTMAAQARARRHQVSHARRPPRPRARPFSSATRRSICRRRATRACASVSRATGSGSRIVPATDLRGDESLVDTPAEISGVLHGRR